MYESFYAASVGAAQCNKRLSIIANNLANVNNTGFKPKEAAFSELIEYNLNDSEDAVTELQSGVGTKVARTYTSFEVAGLQETRSSFDYAITRRNTFFMLRDPDTGEISYTRDGHFHRAERADGFYLMTDSEKFVLDQSGQPMRAEISDIENGGTVENDQLIGLFTFNNPSRLMSVTANEYVPSDAGAAAIPVEERAVVQGMLETSATDVAEEFTHAIECQRAFSYALRMVTTSDEIVSTINNLRT
ncbi:MAG: flagellar hook-basal body protein [Lachnospiraceae bacterium]|nr:flagellar hook-basal body protein [Lachnospiraceae bacterium]